MVREKYKEVYAERATVIPVVVTDRIGSGNFTRGLSTVSKLLSKREKLAQYFSRVTLSDHRLQIKVLKASNLSELYKANHSSLTSEDCTEL